jgi:heme exporter protein C
MNREQVASRVIGAISLALITVVLVLGLFATGPDQVQGEYVRLLYVHPATAWTAYVAFSVTTFASIAWLRRSSRKPFWDQVAGSAAEIGVVFTVLALISGSIWGRPTWGDWWQFDARTTSTLVLAFMYLGVLVIRRVPATFDERARRSAVTALIAFADVPIVHFSVKWWRTLHQQPTLLRPDPTIRGWQLVAMIASFFALTGVFFWMLIQRVRIARWEDRIDQSTIGTAIAARRAEAGQRAVPAGGAR